MRYRPATLFTTDDYGAYISRQYPDVWINVYQGHALGMHHPSRHGAKTGAEYHGKALLYRIKVTFKGKWSGVSQ